MRTPPLRAITLPLLLAAPPLAGCRGGPAPCDRRPGDPPALGDDALEDVIAFLEALDDGWVPPDRGPRAP